MAKKELIPEEKEVKKQVTADKAARDAEAEVAHEANEQVVAEEVEIKVAEKQSAEVGVEIPPSPATSYANTTDDKAQRDTKNVTKGKKEKGQSADAKVVELEAKGLQILTDYPGEHTVYMTANGFGFFKRSDALNHADTLSDKEVLTVNKE